MTFLNIIITFIFLTNALTNVFLVIWYNYKDKKYGYEFDFVIVGGASIFVAFVTIIPFFVTMRIIKELKEKIKKEELKEENENK